MVKKKTKIIYEKGKEVGMKAIKTKLIIFGVIALIVVGGLVAIFTLFPFAIQVGNGGSSNGYVEYSSLPGTPTLNAISPNPDMDSTISLDWSDSLRLWYYNVWRKKSGGSWSIIKRGATSSSFIDPNVPTNGLYYYKIEAVNNVGDVFSGYKSVQIENPNLPGSDPEAHLNIIVPNPSYDGGIQLTWTIESGVIHYTLIQRRLQGGSWSNIKQFDNVYGGGAWLDNTVPTYGTYEYRIKTVYRIFVGELLYWSNVQSVVIAQAALPPDPVPIAPVLNSIIPSPDLDGDIDLSWNQVSGATRYNVYRKVAGGSYARIARIHGVTYIDNDLTNGVYYYKVRATNTEGSSPNSNVVSITVQIYEPLATTLNSIIPNPDTDGNIDLSWASVLDATSYKVYRDNTLITTTTLTSYTDSGLTDGTYSYKVISTNVDGDSGDSNIQSVTVVIPIILILPEATTLKLIYPIIDIDGDIELSWSSISLATEYKVYRDNILIKTTTSTSYIDSGLIDGVYEYKIVCTNADGDSGDSNIQSVTVQISKIVPLLEEPLITPEQIIIIVVVSITLISIIILIQRYNKKKKQQRISIKK